MSGGGILQEDLDALQNQLTEKNKTISSLNSQVSALKNPSIQTNTGDSSSNIITASKSGKLVIGHSFSCEITQNGNAVSGVVNKSLTVLSVNAGDKINVRDTYSGSYISYYYLV